ncbi:unnamed protein product [Prorocentrum cordatum]|uniref:Uncharacterized protein n=1 Tax=Prorocentrum cordatum TaxID=2364126 RepID=A0ABN9VDA7_9DINO|nr:unnamed protein product [Polarella glacialis]
MGVPAEPVAGADCKKHAREYGAKYYKHMIGHIFEWNSDLVNGRGRCAVRGGECSICGIAVATASGGLPCQPCTRQRQKTGNTQKTQSQEMHPGHDEVFEGFLDFLSEVGPAQWWAEEVMDFEPQLHEFAKCCTRAGYAVRAITVDQVDFVLVPRPRLIIAGFSHAAGHKAAADYFVKEMQEAIAFVRGQKAAAAVGVGGVVDTADPDEISRRAALQEQARVEDLARAPRHFSKWQVHSSKIRSDNGVPRSATPWSARSNVVMSGVPRTPRILDLVETTWAVAVAQSPTTIQTKQLKKGLWVGLNQDIKRQPITAAKRARGMPPVMTTGTMYYSFEADATISGKGNLQLAGHPSDRASRSFFSESKLRDLAGETFCAAYCSIVSFVMYCNPHGEWWRSGSGP